MEPMSARPEQVMLSGDARKAVEKLIEVDGSSDADSGDDGVRAPRKVQDEKKRIETEITEHKLTHLPFRSWCAHCIRGRAACTCRHRRQWSAGGPHGHLLLGLSERGSTASFLVIRERDTKMLLSFLVREKGATDALVVRCVMAFLTDLGHTWKQRHHQDRPRVSS